MADAPFVIPIKKRDLEEQSLEELEEISELLSDSKQKEIAQRKRVLELEDKKKENDERLYRLFAMGELGKKQWKYLKIKNKLTTAYHKYIVKGKFFSSILKSVAKLGKAIAGNSLFKIIGSFMLLALFDPKGKFLSSILTFIIKMVIQFIGIFTKMLPKLIKTVIYLVTDVIPPLLKTLISKLFPAIGGMFFKFAKELKDSNPMLAKLLVHIGLAFGEDGMLTKFFKQLASYFPILLTGFVALGAMAKIAGPLMKIASVGKTVLSIGWGLVNFLTGGLLKSFAIKKALAIKEWAFEKGLLMAKWTFKKVGLLASWLFEKGILITKWAFEKAGAILNFAIQMALNPVFLIIAGIMLAVTLIWVFRKQIVDFFVSIGKKLVDFGLMIWNFIKTPYIWLFGLLKKGWNAIKKPLSDLGEKLGQLFEPLMGVFSIVKEKVLGFKTMIIGAFFYIVDGVKNIFSGLTTWIRAILKVGFVDYFGYDTKQRTRLKKVTEYQSTLEKADESGAKLTTAQRNDLNKFKTYNEKDWESVTEGKKGLGSTESFSIGIKELNKSIVDAKLLAVKKADEANTIATNNGKNAEKAENEKKLAKQMEALKNHPSMQKLRARITMPKDPAGDILKKIEAI